MQTAIRFSFAFTTIVIFTACGGGGTESHDAAVDAAVDGGICGTHSNPGVLKLTDVLPATGSTVVNQGIVHGFTIVNAPAEFTSFKIIREDTHTAGISTPFDLQFQATKSGNNLYYRMVVESWTIAPGHVELRAAGSYDTKNGCTWVFPSPLYSYEISPAPIPDGGFPPETGKDGPAKPVDTSLDLIPAIDAPSPLDVTSTASDTLDVPIALDTATEPDAPVGLDGLAPVELDATLDSVGTAQD